MTNLAPAQVPKPGRTRARRWLAFIIMGGINTLVTWLLACALMQVIDYRIAYVVSFVVGIFIANHLYSAFVFLVPTKTSNSALLGLWYAASGAIGTILVSSMTELFGIRPQASIIIAAALLLPCNYIASKAILSPARPKS